MATSFCFLLSFSNPVIVVVVVDTFSEHLFLMILLRFSYLKSVEGTVILDGKTLTAFAHWEEVAMLT